MNKCCDRFLINLVIFEITANPFNSTNADSNETMLHVLFFHIHGYAFTKKKTYIQHYLLQKYIYMRPILYHNVRKGQWLSDKISLIPVTPSFLDDL